jgi:integral membrane sensor domain MASE1
MAKSDSRRPTWLVLMAVASTYAIGALLAFVAFGATSIVVLFLPAGVTLSALLLNPARRWPAILLVVAAVEITVDVCQGIALASACGFALANTAEPLVGAVLLRRNLPGEVDLARRRDLIAFLGCCVLAGPLVGAVIGATTITLSQDRGWLDSFLPFWAGDATGTLTMAGTVLAWQMRRPPVRSCALALLATVAVTAAGFWPQHLPLFYLPIPLLFGLAFAQPLSVTMPAGLAMVITANAMTNSGHGPWAVLEGPIELKTATLQLFLAIAILGACFLTVGIAERDRALGEARRYEREAGPAPVRLRRPPAPAAGDRRGRRVPVGGPVDADRGRIGRPPARRARGPARRPPGLLHRRPDRTARRIPAHRPRPAGRHGTRPVPHRRRRPLPGPAHRHARERPRHRRHRRLVPLLPPLMNHPARSRPIPVIPFLRYARWSPRTEQRLAFLVGSRASIRPREPAGTGGASPPEVGRGLACHSHGTCTRPPGSTGRTEEWGYSEIKPAVVGRKPHRSR